MDLIFIKRGKNSNGNKCLDLFDKIHAELKKDKEYHPKTCSMHEVLDFFVKKKGIK